MIGCFVGEFWPDQSSLYLAFFLLFVFLKQTLSKIKNAKKLCKIINKLLQICFNFAALAFPEDILKIHSYLSFSFSLF
jgi:hypothetical protein